MKNVQSLQYLDTMLLSLPIVLPAAAGVGFGWLETNQEPRLQNPLIKGTGWFGCRCCVLVGSVGSTPLLAYTIAKTTLLKALNGTTCGRFNRLGKLAKASEKTLSVSLIAVPVILNVSLHSGNSIKMGRKHHKKAVEFTKLVQNFLRIIKKTKAEPAKAAKMFNLDLSDLQRQWKDNQF